MNESSGLEWRGRCGSGGENRILHLTAERQAEGRGEGRSRETLKAPLILVHHLYPLLRLILILPGHSRSSGFLCLFLFLHLRWQIINVYAGIAILCPPLMWNWFFIAVYFDSSSPSPGIASRPASRLACPFLADRFLISAKAPSRPDPIPLHLSPILFLQLVDNFSCGRRLLWSHSSSDSDYESKSRSSSALSLIEWSSKGSDIIMHAWSTQALWFLGSPPLAWLAGIWGIAAEIVAMIFTYPRSPCSSHN